MHIIVTLDVPDSPLDIEESTESETSWSTVSSIKVVFIYLVIYHIFLTLKDLTFPKT